MTALAVAAPAQHGVGCSLPVVVAAVVAPTLVYAGAKALSNSTAGKNASATRCPSRCSRRHPTAMLATVERRRTSSPA